jgi:tRNA(His) 5'-end guanylyltransferase
MNEQVLSGELPGGLLSRESRDGAHLKFKEVERNAERVLLPKMWVCVRVDGKSFSTYTKKLTKPFCETFSQDMDKAAVALVENTQGALGAYVQSDEISLILSDQGNERGELAHGGVTLKLASLSAARATAVFNRNRDFENPGLFDGRAFNLTSVEVVLEYLTWRQSDALRNSLESLGRATYGRVKLKGMGVGRLLANLREDEVPLPARHMLGRLVTSSRKVGEVTYLDKRDGMTRSTLVERKVWDINVSPIFLSETDPRWLTPWKQSD